MASNNEENVATVVLSDDDTNSSTTNNSESSSLPKRNIAVKRGTPLPQPATTVQKRNLERNKRDMERISDTNFLHDFNPLNSRREKNKQKNVSYGGRKSNAKKYYTAMYDEHGKLKSTGQDICDCFEESCEGCHFPCEWCQSQKCGLRCRNNRRYAYEMIEFDGKDLVVHNPILKKT